MKKEEENLKNLLEVYNEKNRISSNTPFPPLAKNTLELTVLWVKMGLV